MNTLHTWRNKTYQCTKPRYHTVSSAVAGLAQLWVLTWTFPNNLCSCQLSLLFDVCLLSNICLLHTCLSNIIQYLPLVYLSVKYSLIFAYDIHVCQILSNICLWYTCLSNIIQYLPLPYMSVKYYSIFASSIFVCQILSNICLPTRDECVQQGGCYLH